MPVSYMVVSWEISTAPARVQRISDAVEATLAPFGPARLLTSSVLLDTDGQSATRIRRALDGIGSAFPQEFFYTTADQAQSDLQGTYPPFAELDLARSITASGANPRERPMVPVAAATAVAAPRVGGKARGRRAAAVGRGRSRGRKRGRGSRP
jgi:hypothetical protein